MVGIELPEGADTLDNDEVLVRAIPPEERDWFARGAFVRHVCLSLNVIILSLSLTLQRIQPCYFGHSAHESRQAPRTTTSRIQRQRHPHPPTLLHSWSSRTLLLLQSPTIQGHLTSIHAFSGRAVKLSNKPAAAVESLFQRVVTGRGSAVIDLKQLKGKPGP